MIERSFRIRFSEIETAVPSAPGLYEIVTDEGGLLKVGISGNLRRRFSQHRQSRQSRLKLKEGGDWSNPSDVMSKHGRGQLAGRLALSPRIGDLNARALKRGRIFRVFTNSCGAHK